MQQLFNDHDGADVLKELDNLLSRPPAIHKNSDSVYNRNSDGQS